MGKVIESGSILLSSGKQISHCVRQHFQSRENPRLIQERHGAEERAYEYNKAATRIQIPIPPIFSYTHWKCADISAANEGRLVKSCLPFLPRYQLSP